MPILGHIQDARAFSGGRGQGDRSAVESHPALGQPDRRGSQHLAGRPAATAAEAGELKGTAGGQFGGRELDRDTRSIGRDRQRRPHDEARPSQAEIIRLEDVERIAHPRRHAKDLTASLPLQGQPRGIYETARKLRLKASLYGSKSLSQQSFRQSRLGLISHCLTPISCLLPDTIGEVVINTTTNRRADMAIDWNTEHEKFMRIAYARTLTAARKAFRSWPEWKIDDALAETIAKCWDSYSRVLLRGRDPEPLLAGIVRFSVLWTRYDRKVAHRSRTPDVYDYRAGFRRQDLSGQGQATPSERSSRDNGFIEWQTDTGDDPSELAAALEEHGLTLEDWLDK